MVGMGCEENVSQPRSRRSRSHDGSPRIAENASTRSAVIGALANEPPRTGWMLLRESVKSVMLHGSDGGRETEDGGCPAFQAASAATANRRRQHPSVLRSSSR